MKPRDAAVVLFGLSLPTTFTASLSVAKLGKPGFRAPNIRYRRKTEFNAKWPFTFKVDPPDAEFGRCQ